MAAKFGVFVDEDHSKLPTLYRLPKLHKRPYKSKKRGKDQERYNQVPHLANDTTWESNKTTINITNKIQEAIPFPAEDHKTISHVLLLILVHVQLPSCLFF